MTALMVHRPDDHIAFIRECLDKVRLTISGMSRSRTRRFVQVQKNPNHVRWDLFVTNNKGALPSRPALLRSRQKALPPVRSSNPPSKTSQSLDRRTATKSSSLPPIDNVKRVTPTLPIMLILSTPSSLHERTRCQLLRLGTTNSTKLCARLVERYNRLIFLSVEDIANIDYDERIGKIDHGASDRASHDTSLDLSKQDHRFTCVQNAMEHHRANVQGFIIAGHLDERHFLKKWHDKVSLFDLVPPLSFTTSSFAQLGRIDLIVALTTDRFPVPQRSSNLVQVRRSTSSSSTAAAILSL